MILGLKPSWGLTLTWRGTTPVGGVSLKGLYAYGAAGGDVARFPLWVAGESCVVGDVFRVKGAWRKDAPELCIKGDAVPHDVGHGWRTGRCLIEGHGGNHCAAGMLGGSLEVRGNTGYGLAAGMLGGRVLVTGDAGDSVGGVYDGASQLEGQGHCVGMRGGFVHIKGRAGADVGFAMRRGTLVIEGDVGDGCARAMRAGTVCVGGHVGRACGQWMRRGTLVLLEGTRQGMVQSMPTFCSAGAQDMIFVSLLERTLQRMGVDLPMPQRVERWAGDLSIQGKGEVLLPV